MTIKITTDLKIKYLQQLELECGIVNGQLFEGVDVAEIRSEILMDVLKEDQRIIISKQTMATQREVVLPKINTVFDLLDNEFTIKDAIKLEKGNAKQELKLQILETIMTNENAYDAEWVIAQIKKL